MFGNRVGAFGQFPQNIPGAWGAGAGPLPPGSSLITSGISDDPVYNQKVLEASSLLGPPQSTQDRDMRSNFPREIMLLPELWAGPNGQPLSNYYLTESVMFFEDEQMRGIISRMAPAAVFVGNPTIQMKVLYFNRAKVDQYTHTGTPRLVTRTLDQWNAAIPRVGLGAEFDEEMVGTKAGSQIIRDSIKQIQIAILDHCGIDVLLALLNARVQPTNFYTAQQLPVPSALAFDAMEPELEQWSCLTKTEFGLAKLCTTAQYQIKMQQGAAPDTVIMPPEVADYLRYSRPELTDYNRQGSKGPDRQEAGANAVMQPQLGGLTVLSAPLIPGIDQGPPQDALIHLRMIGEMYFMDFDWNSHVNWGVQLPLVVFDQAAAAGVGEVTNHANRAAIHTPDDIPALVAAVGAAAIGDRPAAQAALDAARARRRAIDEDIAKQKAARTIYIHDNQSDTMQPVTIADIQAYLTGRIAAGGVWAAHNPAVHMAEIFAHSAAPQAGGQHLDPYGWMDYGVLLVRPNMLYATSVFIFAKSGRETAETYIGFGDARWGRDATRKKALIHYTTYAGCVVKRPQNVWVANCVQIKKYLMGGGVQLGVDLFPILIPKPGAYGYDNNPPAGGGAPPGQMDLMYARHRQFLGLRVDAFDGIFSNPRDFVLSRTALWQDLFTFRKHLDGMLMANYTQHQEFNCRVFRGPCEYALFKGNQLDNPRGNHILGKGHWGPWAYDGVGAARLGKGPKPYVENPYK